MLRAVATAQHTARRLAGTALLAVSALSWAVACEPASDSAPTSASPDARPDVLLVVLDTVRADRVSSYGYARPTTPQLDAVAAAGVLFEDVTAAGSWTWPSHASIFTGEPPWVHGAHMADVGAGDTNSFGIEVTRMRTEMPTLAERFAKAGYRTVAIAANEWLSPDLGLVRGFETALVIAQDLGVIDEALRQLARDDDRPLFLFVNLMSAHSPYRTGPGPWAVPDPSMLEPGTAPEWLRPFLTDDLPRGIELSREISPQGPSGVTAFHADQLEIPDEGLALISHLYDAGVRGSDFAFGRILEAWLQRGAETVVAVTSDHGEAFGEHGHLDHCGSVYPELLRVPLVIAAPGRLPAGVRVSTPVSLLALPTTLLRLAGVDAPGADLLGVAAGAAPSGMIEAMSWPKDAWARLAGGRFGERWLLHREGDWALVTSSSGRHELYDLRDDPGMTRDLAAESPARLAEMLTRSAGTRSRAFDEQGTMTVEIDAETRARLERLGYGN